MTVSFVGTSILCNILPIPGRDQHRDEVLRELAERVSSGETLILSVATVIETGNFVAQIKDGGMRRQTARLFVDLMRLVVARKAPWILHEFEWGAEFLGRFLDGAGSGSDLLAHFTSGVGSGDLCMLAEREMYRRRFGGVQVHLWTKDAALAAHS